MACSGKRLAVEEYWLNHLGLQRCRCLFGVLLALLNRRDELGRSPKRGDFSFSIDRRVVTAILSLPTASFQPRPSTPSDDSVRGLQGEISLLARSFVWRSPWASAWFRQPCMWVRQWTAISHVQLCWPTQFSHLSHSRFWLMACQTRQAFLPSSRCEQVRNFPSFDSWLRSCGSLWSSGQDVLEAFERSSSSVEEQDSFVEGTWYTSSWKPGTRLSAIQKPLPFRQSRTNFSLTQNSRPAAQLFDSSANLTTCNLNLAEYFIRFEDIFLNLETGEKQRGRDLVNNNLKHLQGFVF